MYEVFINQHSVIISNSQQNNCDYNFEYHEAFSWNDFFKNMNEKSSSKYVVFGDNIDFIWQHFKSNFNTIYAAGGAVVNNHQMLFIYRNGKWDLPKGKLEIGESIEQCALREVQEECGLIDLKIDKKLNVTFHIYSLQNKLILKETHWFLMYTNFKGKLRPQTEEGIQKVQWFEKSMFSTLMKNSYGNIQKVIDSVEL